MSASPSTMSSRRLTRRICFAILVLITLAGLLYLLYESKERARKRPHVWFMAQGSGQRLTYHIGGSGEPASEVERELSRLVQRVVTSCAARVRGGLRGFLFQFHLSAPEMSARVLALFANLPHHTEIRYELFVESSQIDEDARRQLDNISNTVYISVNGTRWHATPEKDR